MRQIASIDCMLSNPVSPFLSFCEPGLEDVPIVAPVVQLPDAEDPLEVQEGDFAKYDLIICGRCKPDDSEILIKPKPLTCPKAPTAAERLLHELAHLPCAAVECVVSPMRFVM